MDNNQSNLENRRTESSNIRDESAEPSRGVLNRGILNRRNFNRLAAGMGLAAAAPFGLAPLNAWGRDRKDSPNEKSPAELVTPAAKKAIDKGLAYLLRNQIKTGRKRGAFGNNGLAAGVATSSLDSATLRAIFNRRLKQPNLSSGQKLDLRYDHVRFLTEAERFNEVREELLDAIKELFLSVLSIE